MKITSTFLFLSFILLFLNSCGKEGPGGSGKIKGKVTHHLAPIPNSIVYIKYGAKESQDTIPTNYDSSVDADSLGNYEFINLNPGNYYLFGTGYDTAIQQTVYGGIPVKLKKDEEFVTNVPVTED